MFEVSLYKFNSTTNYLDRDIKTTVSYETLNGAQDAWDFGSVLAVVFGYDSCAIYDTTNNKHIKVAYSNPIQPIPLQY